MNKYHHAPARHTKEHDSLQDFIDYSVLHYDDLGRVLSRALKSPLRPKARK